MKHKRIQYGILFWALAGGLAGLFAIPAPALAFDCCTQDQGTSSETLWERWVVCNEDPFCETYCTTTITTYTYPPWQPPCTPNDVLGMTFSCSCAEHWPGACDCAYWWQGCVVPPDVPYHCGIPLQRGEMSASAGQSQGEKPW
jgi:hypothetical protein